MAKKKGASAKEYFDLLVKFAEEGIEDKAPFLPKLEITKRAKKAVQAYVIDADRAECFNKAIRDVLVDLQIPSEFSDD
jgi:hypothetical protein